MGKINVARVILGGLVAGLVLNVIDFVMYGMVLKADFDNALHALGRPPVNNNMIMIFVGLDFLFGIWMVWLYAAIRPRFGAGPKTAVIAGVALWFFVFLLHAVGEAPLGLFPMRLYTIGVIVGLVQYAVAGAVGAYVYKEV